MIQKKSKQRGEVLVEALSIINGERQDAYGNPEDNFATIAEFWTAYMKASRKRLPPNAPEHIHFWITPKDVAVMMALLKIARIATGTQRKDSYVDAAGYIGLAADMDSEAAPPAETDEEREAAAKIFATFIMGRMQKRD